MVMESAIAQRVAGERKFLAAPVPQAEGEVPLDTRKCADAPAVPGAQEDAPRLKVSQMCGVARFGRKVADVIEPHVGDQAVWPIGRGCAVPARLKHRLSGRFTRIGRQLT